MPVLSISFKGLVSVVLATICGLYYSCLNLFRPVERSSTMGYEDGPGPSRNTLDLQGYLPVVKLRHDKGFYPACKISYP